MSGLLGSVGHWPHTVGHAHACAREPAHLLPRLQVPPLQLDHVCKQRPHRVVGDLQAPQLDALVHTVEPGGRGTQGVGHARRGVGWGGDLAG